jgi:hypothetical protein
MKNEKVTMSSVEWLQAIELERDLTLADWNKAKAMHREEHGKTWDDAMENMKARGGNDMRAYTDFDNYYEEKFGGNDE